MGAEDETTRLRRVYGAYATDQATRARWDPEQPGNRAILVERDLLLDDAVARLRSGRDDRPLTLVDLGCGDGQVLASLSGSQPADGPPRRDLIGLGVDLLEPRVRVARVLHPDLPVLVANGSALPLADESVDAMTAFTVFSSILDPTVASAVAREIDRVVRPGGQVLWYDLRRDNPRNPEVHGVSSDDLHRLFPGWSASLRSCTVLPPLARRAARLSARSYGVLTRMSFLHSHLFGELRRPLRSVS